MVVLGDFIMVAFHIRVVAKVQTRHSKISIVPRPSMAAKHIPVSRDPRAIVCLTSVNPVVPLLGAHLRRDSDTRNSIKRRLITILLIRGSRSVLLRDRWF